MRAALIAILLVGCGRGYGEYCASTADCADGMDCWIGHRSICAPSCSSEQPCPDGFACFLPREVGARSACVQSCQTDADCTPDGWLCTGAVVSQTFCEPKAEPEP